MLKKTMTYEDYNGKKVTEDFYFSISKAELIELEIQSGEGGYSGLLKKIIAESDNVAMLATFKDIIAMSIGRRSDDGKRFIKSDEIMQDFQQSPAYDQLILSFYTDTGAAVEFVTGIMPADMAEAVAKATEKGELILPGGDDEDGSTDTVKTEKDETPWITENREPTKSELQNMTPEQLRQVYLRRTAQ